MKTKPSKSMTNSTWHDRLRAEFKHSQFVDWSKIEAFIAQELERVRQEALKAIERAFWDGFTMDYEKDDGDDFDPNDYLPEVDKDHQ